MPTFIVFCRNGNQERVTADNVKIADGGAAGLIFLNSADRILVKAFAPGEWRTIEKAKGADA